VPNIAIGWEATEGEAVKKMLLLVALCLALALVFAPAALAQGAGPGGEGPCTGTPFEEFLPEVNGCVTTEGLPHPGEAIVYDADTREPIGTLEEVSEGLDNATASASASSSASATATASATASASALPDTGGSALLVTLAPLALLVGLGIPAFRVVRHS
jgi:hypothetical protein